jgi:large subunit ribosomal protein L35
LDEHEHAIAKADQENDMHEQPRQPRGKTAGGGCTRQFCSLGFAPFVCRLTLGERICYPSERDYVSSLMPKPIARSKTRKSVAKRFKITARGKILRARPSRRHLLSTKSAKRKRRLGKAARVDETDTARVKANLPFG